MAILTNSEELVTTMRDSHSCDWESMSSEINWVTEWEFKDLNTSRSFLMIGSHEQILRPFLILTHDDLRKRLHALILTLDLICPLLDLHQLLISNDIAERLVAHLEDLVDDSSFV